jgi:hypothetical protein
MWIAGVWNPFLEFPDLLQVLQEKVRQNVIWGYTKGFATSARPLSSWIEQFPLGLVKIGSCSP